MNVEYINPFLKATVNVLKTMAFTDAKAGKPYLKKEQEAEGDVSGIIGLTGETEGSLSVTFSKDCICHVLTNMFGEEVTTIDREVEDAVGEITNMISGDARRELAEKGINLKAAIPSVISGPGHHIRHITSGPVVAIPFDTPAGPFTVEVTLKE
ncbi:MAG: chemotaxis protein CheX [Deltaproteobacteria bacterium]|nr:chemotaxis protein CheX [Deltaproteobacteria bacterium]